MPAADSVVQGAYFRDLLDQPAAIERTLNGLRATPELHAIAASLATGGFRRILLTAMGGSLHALYPLHLELTAAGLICQIEETSELLRYQPAILNPGTLVIVASQSGRSAEILTLLDYANGATILAVTNDAGSPLAQRAHTMVLMAAGVETSVSCKTYLATLVALRWLAAELTGASSASVIDSLAPAAEAARSYLSAWRSHVDFLAQRLASTRQIFLAGRGDSLAAARYGGLTLKESAHFPAEGMSCAAFRHGPFEVIAPHVFVLLFTGDVRTAALNHLLAADIRQAGGDAETVDFNAAEPAFRLPAVPEAARMLLEPLPVQMMSLVFAARDGREAGNFVHLTKVTVVE
jgi:glucosamine--fructose-6-phosphate aminotransferase (isomerizing)